MDRNVLTSATWVRRARRRQAGFTLVEMLVVITIIGLIMALVGRRVLGYLGESKAKAAKIQIETFSSALAGRRCTQRSLGTQLHQSFAERARTVRNRLARV